MRERPDLGPLPSRPTVPSIRASAGRIAELRSASASSSTRWYSWRILLRQPHWFLSAPVSPVLAWVFITGTVMRVVWRRMRGTSMRFRMTLPGNSSATVAASVMFTHCAPVRLHTAAMPLAWKA